MKGLRLFFAVLLAPLALHAAPVDDVDVARAGTRRANTPVATSSSQSPNSRGKSINTPAAITATATRNAPTTNKTTSQASNSRTNITTRDTSTTTKSIGARTTTNTTPRTTGTVSRTPRNSGGGTVRTTNAAPATARATITRAGTSAPVIRTSPTPGGNASASRRASSATIARSAATDDIRAQIMGRDYKTCREVYYSCMDEFCANKDSQLKRCACSSRLHEFDSAKKQLSDVEEQLLNFNQRLLTVNMDKEDVSAMYTATEGELAFQQKDTSDSKKLLDEIANKLKTGTSGDRFNNSLSAISLSLNIDAAFDNIDSMQGASTTLKEGVDLYNAATPICIEMAREVCDSDSLALVESGYQMTIEQDCNTVAKTYQTQTDQAREKIREGAALLDMSRLDIYQKRNSDDILTCKKKMLAMLTDSTVCGTDLGKCLDTTGRYIDPSTGEAFLTVDLAQLGNLISRPSDNQKWTNAPGNDKFVSFLDSKKKYLTPAMENCQDISDMVWDAFIEDALAQIKLAQDRKLEDMRQSCTTLTAQCLSDTAESLADFDARALSTFGVAADKTVNAMCHDIRTACTALLETTGGDTDWATGVTQIATTKTYDTIMQTCREVGRACIIQACKSISGNFGLCEDIQTSVNRKSIINRTSCWDEVVQCVASAGNDSLNHIMNDFDKNATNDDGHFYKELYGANYTLTNDNSTSSAPGNYVYDICANCGTDGNPGCAACRLAEKIWGNCEFISTKDLTAEDSHNMIKIPASDNTATLLSWFAINTGTSTARDSCRDTSCGPGYVPKVLEGTSYISCIDPSLLVCRQNECRHGQIISSKANDTDTASAEICCPNGFDTDVHGNCCAKTITVDGKKVCVPYQPSPPTTVLSFQLPTTNNAYYHNGATSYVICDGKTSGDNTTKEYPGGKTVKCTGQYVIVSIDKDNNISYYEPLYDSETSGTSMMSVQQCGDVVKKQQYEYTNGQWGWGEELSDIDIKSLITF